MTRLRAYWCVSRARMAEPSPRTRPSRSAPIQAVHLIRSLLPRLMTPYDPRRITAQAQR